jgi:hypothetical protein
LFLGAEPTWLTKKGCMREWIVAMDRGNRKLK